MLDCLALKGTKQIRPDAFRPLGSIAAHFSFGTEGCRGHRLRRDRNLGALVSARCSHKRRLDCNGLPRIVSSVEVCGTSAGHRCLLQLTPSDDG